MAPLRFLLVSTHTEQVTGYSKVSHNLLKQLSTLHPIIKLFHFGFQRSPVRPDTPMRPLENVIQYDAAAKALFEQHFPDRIITQIDALDVFAGGGGIHCITQQQPWKSIPA
jgi:hypothetical protein